jgi:hypothetical protein
VLGSIRHHIRIARPAADVWALVGDPARLHEWFPGIVACEVEGDRRTITTGTGLPMPEQILVHDDVARRFQYRVDVPTVAFHRGTLDVIELGPDECLVVYQTDADPRTMALVIGGGARGALAELKQQMEQS